MPHEPGDEPGPLRCEGRGDAGVIVQLIISTPNALSEEEETLPDLLGSVGPIAAGRQYMRPFFVRLRAILEAEMTLRALFP